jgi:hypothetical protein
MFSVQPNMRDSVRSDLLRDEVLERLATIARGEAPTVTAPEPEAQIEAEIEAQSEAEAIPTEETKPEVEETTDNKEESA